MELIIIKNGTEVIARTNDFTENATYSLVTAAELPAKPSEDPGAGHYWKLAYDGEDLSWELGDRPLTDAEKVQQYEEYLPEWRPGLNAVKDETIVLYNGAMYLCYQSHTTQSDWDPVTTLNVLWIAWPVA